MSKIDLTPEKLAKIKEDVKTYKHAYLINPATMLAILEELTVVRLALLELAWEFYGRDQTREEMESCCAAMIENERAVRRESEAGHGK